MIAPIRILGRDSYIYNDIFEGFIMAILKKLPAVAVAFISAQYLISNSAWAFELTFFPPETFSPDTAAMDAALGVTGFEIEDFEDVDLIPGLSITYSGSIPDTTVTTLPNLQEGFADIWDGKHTVSNIADNTIKSRTVCVDCVSLTTFNFDGGVTSVGLGLSGFQSLSSPTFPHTDHLLLINGMPLTDTLEVLGGENFVPDIVNRNTYLRIDASPGELIESIGFQNISNSPADILEFDHLAVRRGSLSVPEPTSIMTLLATGVMMASRILRRRKS